MVSWGTLLIAISLCLLASTSPTPSAWPDLQSVPINTTRILDSAYPTITMTPYEHSIQIIMQKIGSRYWYMFWQGPSGVAVDPCGSTVFKPIHKEGPYRYNYEPIYAPPFPPEKMLFHVEFRGNPKECFYKSTGVDPGQLFCGDYMIMDFAQDPQYRDPVYICNNDGFEYARGYFCEY
ncbi:hypothetical protein PTTW11_02732 [Pyrenophora teres f. teres]|uniref:Uncharacterized protein n=1 Tax=Pyrenophora teres f. teres TaxID=97479 RepID=A0A6S6VSD6_9PLEO|nr:hypothetical protein PTNB29_01200 [Pyrenophora teres f. teres]CAE7014987.1 hypothetical protein PTTW11_02732 [Pyrenophora teres f. teres]